MLDRRQQTGYFRLWQGMICHRRSGFGAAQPTSKGPQDDGRGIAGCPRWDGWRKTPVSSAGKQGRDFFPFKVSVPGIRRSLVSPGTKA